MSRLAVVLLAFLTVVTQEGWACSDDRFFRTVSGLLADPRTYEYDSAEFSEEDQAIFDRAAVFGPLLVLIEEGTGKVRPFYYGSEEASVMEGVAAAQPYVGHRINVTGCISEDSWPSLIGITDVEVLD